MAERFFRTLGDGEPMIAVLPRSRGYFGGTDPNAPDFTGCPSGMRLSPWGECVAAGTAGTSSAPDGGQVPSAVQAAQMQADATRSAAQWGAIGSIVSSLAGAGGAIGGAILGKGSLTNPSPSYQRQPAPSSGLPSWLLPAGLLAGGGFILYKLFGGKRR